MQNEKFSCVREINKTIHVPVPSVYVTNEVVGVTEILESWKCMYIPQLHGVVVDYKNVSVTLNAGHIVTDKHFSHYDVNATFSVFCPTIGSLAKGTVNRISKAHIGCLILNTINVTIHLQENLHYAKVEKFIQLDREIIFEISHFNFNLKVIRVNGKITEECIGLMESMYPNASNNKVEATNAINSTSKGDSSLQKSNGSSSSDDSTDSESLLKENNTSSHITSSVEEKLVLTNDSQSKKSKHSKKEKDRKRKAEDKILKKKHKKKKKNSSDAEPVDDFKFILPNEIKEEVSSLSSMDVPSKQKKRKRESSSSFDLSSLDLSESGHKSKKRKHKKSFEPVDFGDSFKLNEVKEESIPSLLSSLDAVHKQMKRKQGSLSSFDQSSLDLPQNLDSPKKKNRKSKSLSNSSEIKDSKKKKKKSLSSSKKDTPNSVTKKKHKSKKSKSAEKSNILNEDKSQVSLLKFPAENSESSEEEKEIKEEKYDTEMSEADFQLMKKLNEIKSSLIEKYSNASNEDKKESKHRHKKKHKHSPDKKLKSTKKDAHKKNRDKSLQNSPKKSSKKKDSKHKDESKSGLEIKKDKKKKLKDKKSKNSSVKKE